MDALGVVGSIFLLLFILAIIAASPHLILIDSTTYGKLEEMAKQDNKDTAHFFDELLHQEWERRNTK